MFLDVLMISSLVQGPGPLLSMNTRPVVKVLYNWKVICVRKLVKLQSTPPIRSDKDLFRCDKKHFNLFESLLEKSNSKIPSRPGRGFTPLSKEVST
ncbi:hypothetical protein MTR67_044514 [Solanum verrucosum]|uniref:Uncharacterized protein n=1 Tax=Solanum verrucosum TaxID=315347 RepID=A0AAF0UST2_SOLVR|nr:hypothetical protein MTR67_044514 [Solanum verrucosum]